MKYSFRALFIFMLFAHNLSGQIPAQTVPDFEFFRLNNSALTKKDLPQGKLLFFAFYDSDCEHCQRAIQNIGQNYKSFKKTAMYLISLDDQAKINRFMDTYGRQLKGQKNVILLQDKHNQFIAKFKPRRYPSMFLYSVDKKLVDYEDNEETIFRFLKSINNSAK